MISIKNLTHIYKDNDGKEIKALNGIDLDIAEGEFVAVIGANGCGKSTLARHINALLLPTEGTVTVDDMDTQEEAKTWKIRQRVGMVFQNPDNQIVAAVVEEDVAFGPENIGVPGLEICDRVSKALGTVEMIEYAKKAPHLLSGGQKQRLAIAGILALAPKYIVLDEPTAMLDPKGRREVVETVCRLNKEKGITIIYITHHMDEAMLADRVVVMNEGKIVLQGTAKEVFSQPDKLAKYAVESPLAAQVAAKLRHDGIKIGEQIIGNEELVAEICR